MAVLVFGITCPRSFHGPLSLGSGLLVPRPDETALDAPRTIMSEDHESAGSRDIVGIIGLPFRFQPLDTCFERSLFHQLDLSRCHFDETFTSVSRSVSVPQ